MTALTSTMRMLAASLVLATSVVAAPTTATAGPTTAPVAFSVPSATVATPPRLPSNWAQRRQAAAARTGVGASPVTGALESLIDPSEHQCARSGASRFAASQLAALTSEQLTFLVDSGVLDFPTYDALFFGTSGDPAYLLTTTSRARLERTFKAAQRFWDVNTSDVQLMAMHGGVLRDPVRLARLLTYAYGLSNEEAATYARDVVSTVASIPALRAGDNPIFTFNAFAFTAEGDPTLAGVPDKVVVGDGALTFLDSIGIGEVGSEALLSHEFAHHVQYEDDLFASPLTGAEATRRTELMADGFGTYFATHSRGLSLHAKRVLQAERSFYEIGDCDFDYPDHHGTPNQRLRASTWGADLATGAKVQGRILPALALASQFDAVLPQFVAPDAG